MARGKKIKSTTTESRLSGRDAIVQAALRCFVSRGIAQTKTREIAESAGVDQPLVNYHFKSFDQLFFAVVEEVLKSLRDITVQQVGAAQGDTRTALMNYIDAPFLWAEKNPGFFTIWLYFYHIATYQPDFARLDRQIREGGRERISLLLYAGIEQKIFRPLVNLDVRETAITIQGLITGNVIMAATEHNVQLEEFSNLTKKVVAQILSC